jgi:indolepyruvate ferredoxin oxidoreductase
VTIDDRTGERTERRYELADRFRLEEGRVLLTGVQAVARLAGDQLREDRRRGLNTAAFICGYQGSPLAGFGEEAVRAARAVPDLPIVSQAGLNEELAATAVLGSQLAANLDDRLYDGVLGLWYGKAPGLDRASDAIRHAVFAGISPHGGVVAVVGDDPGAKSSSLPSSSDLTLTDMHLPVLFPGDVQEALDLSRHAVALSRSSGLWAGLKMVAPVADGSGTVDVGPDRIVPVLPTVDVNGSPFVPRPSAQLIAPANLAMEREVFGVRLQLAREYAVLNDLNWSPVRGPQDWIGIAATGHTYHEVREALTLLGFDDDGLRAAGIRLIQVRMPHPLDHQTVRALTRGLAEVLVVEEKHPTLEGLFRNALYDAVDRPRITGRVDPAGSQLVPADGLLDADRLMRPLRARLAERLEDRLPEPPPAPRQRIPLTINRSPFYCAGCPHNASTRVEEGTLVGAGIGCHGMAVIMSPERVGNLIGITPMGVEGAPWIGMSPFVARSHMVQNLGDGTFFHSGSLAIRAAIAAKVDMTYKILYNGTVAMTGGQDPAGQMSVPKLASSLLAEGASRVIVTTDGTQKYRARDLPRGVDLWDRGRLDEAQKVLAGTKGVTVLIHDQDCAAEKRRARSRGKIEAPKFRVVINERVCEGCGDCGDKSNCLAVQPVETPYGRKTRIDQTSCNFDFSCMKGDCPAFATVTIEPPATTTKAAAGSALSTAPDPSTLPEPAGATDWSDFTVRLSGIGGTGVVTISQLIGTAAMLDGRSVRALDQTGLSQKAGPVMSDVRITAGEAAAANHATAESVDCLIAFDLLVAASDLHLIGASPSRTVVVGSTNVVPTPAMVVDPSTLGPDPHSLRTRIDEVSRERANSYFDAAAITQGLFGSTTVSNVLMLGVAVQKAGIPVTTGSLERALELNGIAVEQNIAAFRWGRKWAIDPAAVEQAAGVSASHRLESFDELLSRLERDLADYQSEKYAARFVSVVRQAREAETALDPASSTFAVAVARNLHKLMAYKDEYEVARLLLLEQSRAGYERVGGANTSVTFHLHPPMLRAMGMKRKLRLRRSAPPMLRILRAARRLRGTPFDVFRIAEVRVLEREMVTEYIAAVQTLIGTLGTRGIAASSEIASLPDQVRGYEDLKVRRAKAYRAELARRLAE